MISNFIYSGSMQNILIILFTLIYYNNSFAQIKYENETQLFGTWIGKVEEQPIRFEITEPKKDSIVFSFINFQNEKFSILKSDITKNEKNEFVINIKEAKFSSQRFEKCIFSQGVITISDLSLDNMKLNLRSVGPECWIMSDVSAGFDDLNDIKLTKEKSNK